MSTGYDNGARQTDRGSSGQQGSQPADWDGLKDDVSQIADAALERGRGLLGSAKDQATGFLDQRKNDAAQSIVELAHSLRDSSEGFGERPNIRGIVDTAVDGLEQVAANIQSRSVAEIFDDVEAVMRRHPTTVAVTALALGFLAARFVKASSEGLREDFARQQRVASGRVGGPAQGGASPQTRI